MARNAAVTLRRIDTIAMPSGSRGEHAKALRTIPNVPLPGSDPALGRQGPLLRLWNIQ